MADHLEISGAVIKMVTNVTMKHPPLRIIKVSAVFCQSTESRSLNAVRKGRGKNNLGVGKFKRVAK